MIDPDILRATPWSSNVLTLYPDMFPGPLGVSLSGRALSNGVWRLETCNIRDFATDRHHTVDDTPAGGGAGMVLRADVLGRAIDSVADEHGDKPLLLMSPRGERLTQQLVREFALGPGLTIVCGRFEGVDERIIEHRNLREISVGDYILSGGEIAAMVLIDACVRLIPGVMGKQTSGEDESFETGLLEYPQYTRPAVWEGHEIPAVLTSGDHAAVARWRREQSEELTQTRRPDLWDAYRSKLDDDR